MTLHLRPSSIEEPSGVTYRAKPDGNRDPAGETGWFLQRERELRGKSLADAALETHISARYLHALEQGVLADLPARSYVLGYIRVYADFLGLEAEPLVEQYKLLLQDAGLRGGRRSGTGFSRSAMLVAGSILFLCVLTAAVWYLAPGLLGQEGTRVAGNGPGQTVPADNSIQTGSVDPAAHEGDPQDAAADAIAEMLDDAVPTVVVRQEGFADATSGEAPGDDSLQPEDMAAVDPGAGDSSSQLTDFIRQHVTDPVDEGGEGEAAPVDAQGVVYGAENGNARIVLRANKAVWIRIEDADGRIMITRTLQSGDSYRVPDRSGLVLIARDGGALDYTIDGRHQGAIGAPGEIVVGRPLDVGTLARS